MTERTMKPYSTALRIRVVQADETRAGARRQRATTFRVRLSCVRRRLKHSRETGSVAPKPHGGGAPAPVDASGLEVVQALVHVAPDAPLRARGQRFEAQDRRSVRVATRRRVLTPLPLPRTKPVARHGTRARRGAA